MNQNKVDANCEMFCLTMKCECISVVICFALGFIVVSFLTSLKHYSLGLFVSNLFLNDEQHYLVISTGTLEKTFA